MYQKKEKEGGEEEAYGGKTVGVEKEEREMNKEGKGYGKVVLEAKEETIIEIEEEKASKL